MGFLKIFGKGMDRFLILTLFFFGLAAIDAQAGKEVKGEKKNQDTVSGTLRATPSFMQRMGSLTLWGGAALGAIKFRRFIRPSFSPTLRWSPQAAHPLRQTLTSSLTTQDPLGLTLRGQNSFFSDENAPYNTRMGFNVSSSFLAVKNYVSGLFSWHREPSLRTGAERDEGCVLHHAQVAEQLKFVLDQPGDLKIKIECCYLIVFNLLNTFIENDSLKATVFAVEQHLGSLLFNDNDDSPDADESALLVLFPLIENLLVAP